MATENSKKIDLKKVLLRELSDAKQTASRIGTYTGTARGRTIDPLVKPSLNLIDRERQTLQRIINGLETKINLYLD